MARDYKKNLVNYFKKNLKKGYTIDSLRLALINQGYLKILVEQASEKAIKELSEEAPILKEKPVIKYEIIDEYDNPIKIKKSKLRKFFGF
jgi:hypothetical protein